jgi:hypothetical protein
MRIIRLKGRLCGRSRGKLFKAGKIPQKHVPGGKREHNRPKTPEEYGKLIMATMQHGGHQHPAGDQSGVPPTGEQVVPAKDDHHH